ncbi:Na+/H+ antiporter NhaC family protein [Alteromonas sp. RKMC-009]|uniref:Na+/H+ antiporter NhaC family protein n=1 Tax=Alteromonas sp. RKMC-009 TaxID=2267264 RepID=UPI000E67D11A|nr:Na+/H+ antiporter NhaC family protein [Alteromonas sp. RKMC-009]AYA66253.1 Na+/H+ antiporter NhaC family protein [Alteromonas sp. RKMC-009]
MQKSAPAQFLGLTPILFFVVTMLIAGIISDDITAMPVLVALFLAAGYALLLNPKGQKLTLNEKIAQFCEGAGNKNIILLVLIFLLAGAFYSLTIDIGARDATVNLALSVIPTPMILPGLFIICCFISFSMGTSTGTITALAPIGLGLADGLGVSPALLAGVVVGGAMFGDNLSFVSDTTIAATRSQGVRLTDKFKANLLITLPASVITIIILAFVSVADTSSLQQGDYELIRILPYMLIIACALAGLNVVLVLAIGIGSAGVIGLITGSFAPMGMWQSIQTGLGWMQNLSVIALTIGGIVSLMHAYGGITWLIQVLTRRVQSRQGAEYSIAALVSLLDLSTANNTISIVAAGPIASDLNKQYGVDPRRTASILDVFSCSFQGLVPYGAQILTIAAVGGLSPLSVSMYCWYPMLLFVFGVLAIAFNIPKFVTENGSPDV